LILYLYNNLENLGYRNLDGYGINLDFWRFLYINPSCQIVPVSKLSSEIMKLQNELKEAKEKFSEEKSKNESIFNQINAKWREKFNENIFELDYSQEEKFLQAQIEKDFKEKLDSIKKIDDFTVFDG